MTLDLLSYEAPTRPLRGRIDGAEVARNARNAAKLNAMLAAVYSCLANGEWWSVSDLAFMSRQSENCAGANARNLRKARHGGHNVVGERGADSVYRYRLLPGVWPAAHRERTSKAAARIAELEAEVSRLQAELAEVRR
jgi:hypothetical protein